MQPELGSSKRSNCCQGKIKSVKCLRQVQVLDQLFVPVVMPTPVEIPQVQLGQGFCRARVMHDKCLVRRAENCGAPQLQCVDEEVDVPVVQVVEVSQVQFNMAVSSWTRLLTCPLLYVRVQVRRKLWRSHSCSSWTRGSCPTTGGGCGGPCDCAALWRRLWRGGDDEPFSPIFCCIFRLPL